MNLKLSPRNYPEKFSCKPGATLRHFMNYAYGTLIYRLGNENRIAGTMKKSIFERNYIDNVIFEESFRFLGCDIVKLFRLGEGFNGMAPNRQISLVVIILMVSIVGCSLAGPGGMNERTSGGERNPIRWSPAVFIIHSNSILGHDEPK